MKIKKSSLIVLRYFLPILFLCLLIVEFCVVYEYVNVGILGNSDGYPWGWRGADNYTSPEVYAASMLKSSVIVFVELCLVLFIWFKLPKKNSAI
jgi:hypothetical protein